MLNPFSLQFKVIHSKFKNVDNFVNNYLKEM